VTSADDLSPLRRLVAEAATSAGLPPGRAAQLVTAVNEIAANAIMHGIPPADVTVSATSSEITVAVHDHGPGPGQHLASMPAAGSPPPVAAHPPPAHAAGGRGLWLATQMADRISVISDGSGTTVTATMAIRAPTSR
jgi:anti-sigma regulatory factor (Ser/Thr protein kinase)